MSQMLIGILALVLVIGLALAGASYFGDDVLASRAKSRAAAVVSATSQVANAVSVRYAEMGGTVPVTADISATLVTPGYLQGIPIDPIGSGNSPRLMTASGSATSGMAEIAVLDLGADAEPVCVQIGVQAGQLVRGATSPVVATSFPVRESGCFKAGAGAGGDLTVGNFYAFTRI